MVNETVSLNSLSDLLSLVSRNARDFCVLILYSATLPNSLMSSSFLVASLGSFMYRTTWPASWETYMQVRKQQLELDMEQQTGSKLGKEYIKAVYCHPAFLTSMQNTSWEMLDWMKHKLELRLPREILITSDMQMTPHLRQKAKKN